MVVLFSAVKALVAVKVSTATFTPQDCSLECLRQGAAECKYCRITREDVEKALGSKAVKILGSCIPWPCFELMGNEGPHLCQHYVHAPNNVTVEIVEDPDPTSDTVVISWRPSPYGIEFLRGFQVSLQALGGSSVFCQLFLFHLCHMLKRCTSPTPSQGSLWALSMQLQSWLCRCQSSGTGSTAA